MRKNSKHTEVAKLKNRQAHIGKRTGEKNNKWKGDNVGYYALHAWVRAKYGKPNQCENKNCPKKSTTYQWSNVSGRYLRDKKDWQQLCASCHKVYDYKPSPFCRRGHELEVVGILIDNRGSRICKECKRNNARKYYLKNKDKIIKRITKRRRLIRSTLKR